MKTREEVITRAKELFNFDATTYKSFCGTGKEVEQDKFMTEITMPGFEFSIDTNSKVSKMKGIKVLIKGTKFSLYML